jgi:hypothetical protein
VPSFDAIGKNIWILQSKSNSLFPRKNLKRDFF